MMRESLLQDLSLWGCLWQSMAFIALGLMAGYLLRRRPSRAYQVLLFVMMAAAIVPLMSAVVKHFDLGVFTARASESFGTSLEGLEAIPLAGTDDLAGIAIPAAAQPADINSGSAELTSTRFSFEWRTVVVYGWMIATLTLLARLIVTFMYGAYIVRNAQRSGCEQLQQAVDDVTLNLGLSYGLRVRGSRRIRSPIVWCWSHPPILLVPNSCRDPKIDWAGVVAHELAHCKRWDHITGLIAELMVCLLPWNPLIWLSKKCLVRFGEQACDDWVVATGQPSEDYAESLLRFRPQKQMAFLPAVVHSKKGLAGRVDRILKDSCGNPRTGTKWALATSLATLCLTVGVAFAQTRPAEPSSTEAQERTPAKSLHEAAEGGDVEEVKRLIVEGADVNATEGDSAWTPLLSAATGGHAEVIEVLLANGAKVNKEDSYGYTPLYYAIWSDDKETVKTLISGGADVNKRPANKRDYPPLIYAIWQGHKSNVEIMLNAGADINTKDETGNSGNTPLYWAAFSSSKDILDLILSRGKYNNTIHLAACKGDMDRVTTLIEGGTDVNNKDKFGCIPLHWAVLADSSAVADYLLTKGADLDAKDGLGFTPLKNARALPVVELLISKGADIHAKTTRQGRTKLHGVCFGGDREVVELLIRKGADIHVRDNLGMTPLYRAARGGHASIVELLIEKGADINASDNRGRTPLAVARQEKHVEVINILRQHGAKETLHGAVISGNVDAVKRLISGGHDVNSRDNEGQTPLHAAAFRDRKDVVEILIAKGADIEARDNEGTTPLLGAAARGHKEVVEFLLAKGADIDGKNNGGATPLSLTVAYGTAIHTDVIQLLLDRGANIECRGGLDCTPLQSTVAVGRKEVAELLITHGARVNVMSRYFGTPAHNAMRENQKDMVRWCISKGIDIPPIHQAAYFGEIDKVRSLLKEGANVNEKDIAQFTPLQCAVLGQNAEIAKLLLESSADVGARNCAHATPLFWACARGYLDIVKVLVDNGAEVNDQAFRGFQEESGRLDSWSSLHVAAQTGYVDVVEYLLAHGADIHARCARRAPGGSKALQDLTALHLAAWAGHTEVVTTLLAKGADVNLKSKEGHT
ncbi:ankyrin repeat domain-containing protein, partial [Planctomycetota bacterium]